MEFNIISFIFIYSPADSRKPWLPYRLVCQRGEGLLRGDSGRDRDRDRREERSQRGGGQSETEEALGAECQPSWGGRGGQGWMEKRWRQRTLVSAGTLVGVGPKAGQTEELGGTRESQERTSGAGPKGGRWLVGALG